MSLGRIAFEAETVGGHVRVTVRDGVPGSRALAGNLCLSIEGWQALRAMVDPTCVSSEGGGEGVHAAKTIEGQP